MTGKGGRMTTGQRCFREWRTTAALRTANHRRKRRKSAATTSSGKGGTTVQGVIQLKSCRIMEPIGRAAIRFFYVKCNINRRRSGLAEAGEGYFPNPWRSGNLHAVVRNAGDGTRGWEGPHNFEKLFKGYFAKYCAICGKVANVFKKVYMFSNDA